MGIVGHLISTGRSGKREVAIALLMFWAFFYGRALSWLAPEQFKIYEDSLDNLTWATFAFAAAAYGLDFAVKSGIWGGGGGKRESTPRRRSVDRAPPEGGMLPPP